MFFNADGLRSICLPHILQLTSTISCYHHSNYVCLIHRLLTNTNKAIIENIYLSMHSFRFRILGSILGSCGILMFSDFFMNLGCENEERRTLSSHRKHYHLPDGRYYRINIYREFSGKLVSDSCEAFFISTWILYRINLDRSLHLNGYLTLPYLEGDSQKPSD